MKIKHILLALLLLIVFIPTFLYVFSLDLSKKHSKKISQLALYPSNTDTGQFRLKANGLEFVVRVAGMQNKGKCVILLHGFPESSIMWENIMVKLAQEGYRVLAFDQRGYSPNARPSKIEDYELNKLSEDVLAVAKAVGFERFHLVGHDWGAVVGWKVVMDNPNLIDTWTALSIPHIGAFFDGVVNDSIQKKRSGYFKFFKTPFLPEFLLTYRNQKNMKGLLAALPKKDFDETISILAEQGALTAELNWYRAMNVEEYAKNKTFSKKITTPTLFIWGKKDLVIAEKVIKNQEIYFDSNLKTIALNTGHNLVQQQEKEVFDAILAHWKKKNSLT